MALFPTFLLILMAIIVGYTLVFVSRALRQFRSVRAPARDDPWAPPPRIYAGQAGRAFAGLGILTIYSFTEGYWWLGLILLGVTGLIVAALIREHSRRKRGW